MSVGGADARSSGARQHVDSRITPSRDDRGNVDSSNMLEESEDEEIVIAGLGVSPPQIEVGGGRQWMYHQDSEPRSHQRLTVTPVDQRRIRTDMVDAIRPPRRYEGRDGFGVDADRYERLPSVAASDRPGTPEGLYPRQPVVYQPVVSRPVTHRSEAYPSIPYQSVRYQRLPTPTFTDADHRDMPSMPDVQILDRPITPPGQPARGRQPWTPSRWPERPESHEDPD